MLLYCNLFKNTPTLFAFKVPSVLYKLPLTARPVSVVAEAGGAVEGEIEGEEKKAGEQN